MSFFSSLIAGGAAGLFSGIGEFAKSIREAITGEAILDPNKRAELLAQTAALEAASEKARLDFEQKMSEGQTAINAIEAQNTRLFVSGWRPAVGWICVVGLGYVFLLKPLLPWIVSVVALIIGKKVFLPEMPEIPLGDLITLLAGMLGLSALRTTEKIKKVNSK